MNVPTKLIQLDGPPKTLEELFRERDERMAIMEQRIAQLENTDRKARIQQQALHDAFLGSPRETSFVVEAVPGDRCGNTLKLEDGSPCPGCRACS